MTKMKEMPTIGLRRRAIEVKRGDNAIYLTKNDVAALNHLINGTKYEGVYTSNTLPRTRYALAKDGTILATCKADGHDEAIVITPKVVKQITQFRENNSPKIAWDRDFKGRW